MNTSTADNPVQWLFLDLNAFFSSCEQQENPALRGKPVIVVQTMTGSAVAIAAGYAKAFGRAAPAGSLAPAAPTLRPGDRSDTRRPRADKSGGAPPSTSADRHHRKRCSRRSMPFGAAQQTFGLQVSHTRLVAIVF
jgi:hypothetical protein